MRHAVHFATIKRTTATTRDSAGRTTPVEMSRTVPALAALLGQREQAVADSLGRTVSVAVQVPSGTDVDTKDHVVVSGTGDLGLDGRYTIVELRPTRFTKRLMLARYEV